MSETQELSRLDHLREMVAGLQDRMAACDSDQNYSVMARVRRELLSEIDELGGGIPEQKPETKLDEFSKRLAARESGAKAPRRTKSS